LQLSNENWEEIFDETNTNNVDLLFNKFLDIYLKIFQACFQKRKVSLTQMGNPWTTKGIKISCARKRELYLITRQNNDVNTRNYYKRYCRILPNTIKLAKKLHYDSLIAKAQNKFKTAWRIIKSKTNKIVHQTGIQSLKINNSATCNQDDIAHAFNNYSISVADSVVNNITRGKTKPKDNLHAIDYLNLNFGHSFPDI
jgi:hypothetical protein